MRFSASSSAKLSACLSNVRQMGIMTGIYQNDESGYFPVVLRDNAVGQAMPTHFYWPGLFIILIALSVNFLGDGLRDAFDPRQSRSE